MTLLELETEFARLREAGLVNDDTEMHIGVIDKKNNYTSVKMYEMRTNDKLKQLFFDADLRPANDAENSISDMMALTL